MNRNCQKRGRRGKKEIYEMGNLRMLHCCMLCHSMLLLIKLSSLPCVLSLRSHCCTVACRAAPLCRYRCGRSCRYGRAAACHATAHCCPSSRHRSHMNNLHDKHTRLSKVLRSWRMHHELLVTINGCNIGGSG